jgi:hypothetical protein
MTPSDSGDAGLFRAAVAGLLDENLSPEMFNDRLIELGWREVAIESPDLAVGVLFEEMGARGSAAPALDLVVLAAAEMELVHGDGVLHPVSDLPAARTAGQRVLVDGVALAGAGGTRWLVPGDSGWVAVNADAATQMVRGLDPAMGLYRVSGEAAEGLVSPVGFSSVAPVARRALAHQLVGLAAKVLALAVRQVTDREQYGRQIGSFQTVKHRLAETEVAVTAARTALAASWRAHTPLASDVAKALAGRAALLATRHAQQVCGGIGFTEEHPLPDLVRRAYVLDGLYGSASLIEESLGVRLVSTRAVPRLSTPWSGGTEDWNEVTEPGP